MQENADIKSAIETLEHQREQLIEELNSLDRSILILKNRVNSNSSNVSSISKRLSSSGYDKTLSIPEKVIFILKQKNRFLRFREIAEIITEYEGLDKKDVSALTNRLSNSCAELKTSKAIVKLSTDNSNINTFWGSPKWLDESGNIIKGHEYNAVVIEKKAKIKLEI
jgi:hypothetical protein